MNSKLVKVGAAALNQTPLDWKNNFENIVNAIQAARKVGVKVLCLPELCITGYGCEDQFHALYVHDNAVKALFEISKHTDGMVVSVGLPILYNGHLYNASCLMVDGHIGGFVCKQFLAGDGIHYEQRWFKPWESGRVEEISLKGEKYPIGDLFFKVYDIKIGFEICEDAWVANRPGAKLAMNGVDVILNPSASHFAFGKHMERRRIVCDSSRAFKCAYVYANLLGNESGRSIYSGDTIISSCGKEVAVGQILSYKDFVLSYATVDLLANTTSRIRSTSMSAGNGKPYSIKCKSSLAVDDLTELPTEQSSCISFSKEDEFSKAVALGLFDYLRKTRSSGFVVSLSGGADSSAVAILVWIMCRDAIDELGVAQLESKLAHIGLNIEKPYHRSLVNNLLTCVYQGTENSSKLTLEASEKLASFIGAKFYDVNINGIVNDYKSLVADSMSYSLSWKKDDVTLQNIQARARGPLAWMIANINNSILLSTSNRSEAAVGYATMDGDTCGGLSPIAGIDKHFLKSWLKHMEKYILALELVNNQEPTAELRPLADRQTDESDLMPYDILNKIECLAIKDKKSPLEIFKLLCLENIETHQQYGEWVEKFFVLWARNQWKRERYAPSFHLDDESLDPKTWCRFPILSGQFKSELYEMWQYINHT